MLVLSLYVHSVPTVNSNTSKYPNSPNGGSVKGVTSTVMFKVVHARGVRDHAMATIDKQYSE